MPSLNPTSFFFFDHGNKNTIIYFQLYNPKSIEFEVKTDVELHQYHFVNKWKFLKNLTFWDSTSSAKIATEFQRM